MSRPLCSEVAHAIRQTASRKATGPDEVLAELFKAGETVPDKKHRIYLRSGKLVSGQRNGRSGHSSHFPRKVIFDWSANYRTIARLTRKQDPSLDHTRKDPSTDQNRNCRQTGGISTSREGRGQETKRISEY